MLLKIIKFLRGYVKVEISGYSPERFMNLCSVHGIVVWDVCNLGLAYEMCLNAKDFRKLRPLVRKTKVRLKLKERRGLPFFLFKFRHRKMFFAGGLLCALIIYGLSLFVWNIHVEGNASHTTEEILSYLETCGVVHGSFKSTVSCTDIEKGIRNEFPEFLWVSAQMQGTRILIQIKENTDADIVSEISEPQEDAMSIVAKVSGIVDSMIVRKGTPMVAEGDSVVVGQVLTAGYYPIINDAGETIRYEGVCADADIVIRAVESYEDTLSRNYEKQVDTGRSKLHLVLILGEKEFFWTPKVSYENYRTVEETHVFRLTENFYLPVSLKKIRHLEYTTKQAAYTDEELKSVFLGNLQEECENILKKGVQIIEKDVRIDTNGDLCVCFGTLTMLVPAQTKVPADIPQDIVPLEEGETET